MSDFPSSTTKALGLIVAVVIGGGFYLYGKNMERRSPADSPLVIAVSADAKVSTPPDIATLSFGITTGRQPTAKAATTLIAQNMTKVLAAVKAVGIDREETVRVNHDE